MVLECKLPYSDELSDFINNAGFDQLTYQRRWKYFRISIRAQDLVNRKDPLKKLIGDAFSISRSIE
jgi:hypothetical protein